MWSARATSYRTVKGYAHDDASIPVVVQCLIDSDTAVVLFTGNPITAATDEYLVNASWGLAILGL
jgi:pyruvate,water dikinase